LLNFRDFKTGVNAQFTEMIKHDLFVTNTTKDELWEMYLNSFPEGSNPIYKERTEHDCQCCKQFIRACGNVVAIINDKLVSIWDIKIDPDEVYLKVAKAMSKFVKSRKITDVFLHYEKNLGTDFNHQILEDTRVIKWEHFHFKLPNKFVNTKNLETVRANRRSNKEVFIRSLKEISLEAAETVLELIEQNSIYRGGEHKQIVELFIRYKEIFDKLKKGKERELYCWQTSLVLGDVSKIRNTVIGTLLSDISNDETLDRAVKKFESKVAPTNYKRPTALITKAMKEKALKTVKEQGIENSLQRRFAITEDISINNVLFADRTAKAQMDDIETIFDLLPEKSPDKIKNLDKVEEVDISTFINDILPKVESVELLVDNKFEPNFMSLIAPENADAPNILKWDNNFSWAYNGNVTDSIKEKVENAGGDVTGIIRCSLGWYNHDDLDIHVIEPRKPPGSHIYYVNKTNTLTSGKLDVDMNAGGRLSRNAVENITWTNKAKMLEGVYEVFIHQYTKRETDDVGFVVEIEYNGTIHSFQYTQAVRSNAKITVAKFEYSKTKGIKFINSIIPSTRRMSKGIWNIDTQKFHKVSMIMNSPNHWDGNKTGNKHYFFILEGCKNEDKVRGFFNEYLNNDLMKHRKVFEMLGNEMKVEHSDRQLSGLGFSSTQKNQIVCKVSGSFSRVLKINF